MRLAFVVLILSASTASADEQQPVTLLPELAPGVQSSHCGVHPDGSKSTADEGEIQLRLVGIEWLRGWRRLCGDIVKSANLGSPPYDDDALKGFHDHLMRLGYFESVRCAVDATRKRISCDMLQKAMVYGTSVSGKLPFSILRSDVKQRLYLRPGAALDQEQHALDRQKQRVHDYLQDSGYFDSEVELHLTPESGAEPNAGYHVRADIVRGRSYKLGTIAFTGTKLLTDDDARSTLTHYWLPFLRMHFQPSTFENDLDVLGRTLQKRGWPEARVKGSYELDDSTGLANITLDVKSGPLVRIAFVGNKAIDDDDLLDESTFEEAQSVDSGTVDDMAAKITLRYQRDGYFQVEVSGKLRTVSPTVAEVVFEIKEGPRGDVDEVAYNGNNTFDDKRLVKGAGLLLQGAKKWVYDYSDHDIAVLRDFYHHQGFDNTQVATSVVQTGPGSLRVDFDIVEGPRRTVANVDIRGLPDTANAKLVHERLKAKPGAPFVQEEAEGDKRLISALLAADGFPRAEVEQFIEGPGANEGGAMRITYTIDPGERSRYGGVMLRGDFRTRRSLLEQELGLKEGDPLDVTAVGAATRRLRGLGIFSSVQLIPLDGYEGGDTWLLAELQERPAVRLDGSISYSTNDAFQVGTDFSDRNVFGRAIQFALRVRWGNANQALPFIPAIGNMDEAVATLRAPRPLGFPFDLVYRASYVYEDRSNYDELLDSNNDLPDDYDPATVGDYDERRVRGSVALVRTLLERGTCLLCPSISGSLNYELSGVTTWYNEGRVTANFGRIYPLLSFDARDSPTDPHKGYYAEGRIEWAQAPMGLILENPQSFWRFIGRLSVFFPLGSPFQRPHPKEDIAIGGPLVLAVNGTYGIGAPIGADPATCDQSGQQRCELPPSEVFAYGGDFSLRGLRQRESFDAVSDARTIFNGTAELRWYMIQDLGFGTLQIAAFLDYGSVANKDGSLFADQTISVGPAIRYVTAVGPLSVAYGHVIQLANQLQEYDAANDVEQAKGRFVIGFGYTF